MFRLNDKKEIHKKCLSELNSAMNTPQTKFVKRMKQVTKQVNFFKRIYTSEIFRQNLEAKFFIATAAAIRSSLRPLI